MPAKKTWTKNDVRQFKELCGIFCSREEVCAVMGLSEKTLNRLIDEHLREEVNPDSDTPITFKDAFEYYSAAGRSSLRRKQFEVALKGNTTMLIYLGKTVLGQVEPTAPQVVIQQPAEEVAPIDDILARRAASGKTPENS